MNFTSKQAVFVPTDTPHWHHAFALNASLRVTNRAGVT